jgi:hypothetical protein
VRIVLYGVSTPHASELVESIRRLGWELVASVVNVPDPPAPPAEVPFLVGVDDLDPRLLELPFAVPQTDPAQREAAVGDARARGFAYAAEVIDPTAIVASSAGVDPGIYVGAGSVVGAGAALGEGCLVNRSCSIAHHVRFEPFASTGPGVVLAGGCVVERGAFVGAGVVLAPGVRIGEGAVVGAGAVVIRDVAPGSVVVGNPARTLDRSI